MNWIDGAVRNGTWSFMRCATRSKYFCKKPESDEPMCPGGFVEGVGSCWQMADKTQLSFDDAITYCRAQNGYLAEIYGQEEQPGLKIRYTSHNDVLYKLTLCNLSTFFPTIVLQQNFVIPIFTLFFCFV